MSRLYFHSPNKTVELPGWERHELKRLLKDNFYIEIPFKERSKRAEAISAVLDIPYNHSMVELEESLFQEQYLMGDSYLSVMCNTSLSTGKDSAILAARVHGQCEIHAYIEGSNRRWFAGVLRKTGYLQKSVPFLEEESAHPVVLSFSVSERFPDSVLSEEENGNLSWDLAFSRVRQSDSQLEISPSRWESYHFRAGWDARKINWVLRRASEREGCIRSFILGVRDFYNSQPRTPKENWERTEEFVESRERK